MADHSLFDFFAKDAFGLHRLRPLVKPVDPALDARVLTDGMRRTTVDRHRATVVREKVPGPLRDREWLRRAEKDAVLALRAVADQTGRRMPLGDVRRRSRDPRRHADVELDPVGRRRRRETELDRRRDALDPVGRRRRPVKVARRVEVDGVDGDRRDVREPLRRRTVDDRALMWPRDRQKCAYVADRALVPSVGHVSDGGGGGGRGVGPGPRCGRDGRRDEGGLRPSRRGRGRRDPRKSLHDQATLHRAHDDDEEDVGGGRFDDGLVRVWDLFMRTLRKLSVPVLSSPVEGLLEKDDEVRNQYRWVLFLCLR